jgi:predicted nucleic acid-binding protein
VILADSDVLIEHLRGTTAARDWLVDARQSSGPPAISVVSLTEIAAGMRPPERREVTRLLGSMQRFEVTEQAAWRAATLMQEYHRSHPGTASATTCDTTAGGRRSYCPPWRRWQQPAFCRWHAAPCTRG